MEPSLWRDWDIPFVPNKLEVPIKIGAAAAATFPSSLKSLARKRRTPKPTGLYHFEYKGRDSHGNATFDRVEGAMPKRGRYATSAPHGYLRTVFPAGYMRKAPNIRRSTRVLSRSHQGGAKTANRMFSVQNYVRAPRPMAAVKYASWALNDTETYNASTEVPTAIGAAWDDTVFNIERGTGVSKRVGRAIKTMGIDMVVSFDMEFSTSENEVAGIGNEMYAIIYIVRDTDCRGAHINASDVFDNVDNLTPFARKRLDINSGRYVVTQKKIKVSCSTTSDNHTVGHGSARIFIPGGFKVGYDADASSTGSGGYSLIVSNNIAVFVKWDHGLYNGVTVGDNQITCNVEGRTRWIDVD